VIYIELKIPKPANQDKSDLLIAEMADHGFESFVEKTDSILAYIPQKDYAAEILLQIEGLKFFDHKQLTLKVIEDQNWNAVWESNYPPVSIGGRCFIHAPFHNPNPEVEFNILIKPKMAFGTAHHETTAMMVELLLDEAVKDKRVLDMGSGTAVLAILAAMKGAAYIRAIDNDEWAYNNAIENIKLNRIENIDVELGDANILHNKDGFDLILANINKNILLNDMSAYTRVLKSGGEILLSGFYEDDLEDIRYAAKQNGMNFVLNKNCNKWVAAKFVKQ